MLAHAHSMSGGDFIIHMSETGYNPENLEIVEGDTVVFENVGKEAHWPASNIHPTHSIYPEFDPQKPIEPGKSWSFTFARAGQWKFHDHLFPQFTGSIVMKKNSTQTKGFVASMTELIRRVLRIFGVSFLTSNSTKNKASQRYNPNISEIAPEIFKDEAALFSYVKKYGPAKTTKYLHELTSLYGDCHQPAHKAGRFSYEIFNEKAFQKCGSECHSGCYHGATEAYFRDHGTQNLTENLKVMCISELNPFFSHQCIHGIGHGLMAWSNYDINEALRNCDLLAQKKDSCYTGVFMENIVGGLAKEDGHQTKYLNADPQFPCTIVEEKYKGACYFYQTSRMVQLFKGDFAQVAKACSQAPAQYQVSCFASMGRDVDGTYRGNSIQAIATCNNAPVGIMRNSCLSGAVQDAFWDPSGSKTALSFCKLLTNQNEKQACYGTIIDRAIDLLNEVPQRKTFCEEMEVNQQKECKSLLKI